MSVKPIIDKTQVEANRLRAIRRNISGADFLLQRALDDLGDRVAITKRVFDDARIVSPWAKSAAPKIAALHNIAQVSAADRSGSDVENDVLGLGLGQADLLLDIFNLHQANDVPGMLVQYCRALRPDGLFLACVPGGDTLHELRQSLLVAETELSSGVRPRVLPFMDVRDAGALLQRAGFALPVADVDSVVVRYNTMFDLMFDLRAMGSTNTLIARQKSMSKRALFARAAAYYADHYSDEDGRIRATFSFVWMSGWAPDKTQPKPLKPGSATHKLADVLKDTSKRFD